MAIDQSLIKANADYREAFAEFERIVATGIDFNKGIGGRALLAMAIPVLWQLCLRPPPDWTDAEAADLAMVLGRMLGSWSNMKKALNAMAADAKNN